MKIIAQQEGGVYLVQTAKKDNAEQAIVVDMEGKRAHPPFNLQSILARGYWEDPPEEIEKELKQEILGLAIEASKSV